MNSLHFVGCVVALLAGGGIAAEQPAEGLKPFVTLAPSSDGGVGDFQWAAFAPDGKSFAIRSKNAKNSAATLTVFDLTSRKPILSKAIQEDRESFESFGAFVFSPKSDWLAYTENRSLVFVPIPPHKPTLPAEKPVIPLRSVIPDCLWLDQTAEKVYVGSAASPFVLEKWDLKLRTAEEVFRTTDNVTRTQAGAVNVRENRFAVSLKTVFGGGSIECRRLGEKPSTVVITPPLRAESLALSPDGKVVAAGFPNGRLNWYDTDSGNLVRQGPKVGLFPVRSLAFHPGGDFLACATYDKRGAPNLFVVRLDTAEVVASLVADLRGVHHVCFSPKGDRLAAVCGDGDIRIWNAAALLKLERE